MRVAGATDGTEMSLIDLIGRPNRWGRLFGWTALVGLLCGLIGPYGSFVANPASRMIFWVSLFWAGTLILWPSIAAALVFAERRAIPPIFAGCAAALIACVPLSACAALACSIFWPVHASGILPQEYYGQTLILALPAAAVAFWFEWYRSRVRPAAAASMPAAEGESLPPRPSPLPDHLLDLVLCLQMEDHHVRYYTAGGSRLHFAPMRDVVGQLGDARGLQVHRSWWVARSAVRASTGDSRSLELILSNGLHVPVARSRVAAVRTEGWVGEHDPDRAAMAGAG